MIRWLAKLRHSARQRRLEREIEAGIARQRLIREARSQAAKIGFSTELRRRGNACRELQKKGLLPCTKRGERALTTLSPLPPEFGKSIETTY